jgi:adenosine deaminase
MTFDMPDMLKSAHVGRIVLGLCLMSGSVGVAQSAPLVSGAEQRTVRAFEAASKNPLELRVFLQGMPKGGDLHLHLSGGTVYSETLIRDAVQDGLCVKTATMTLFKPQDSCGEGAVPAGNALKDQNLYDSLVNAFSMRNFVPSSGISGHDPPSTASRRSGSDMSASGSMRLRPAPRSRTSNILKRCTRRRSRTLPNSDIRLGGAATL